MVLKFVLNKSKGMLSNKRRIYYYCRVQNKENRWREGE